jgi:shikimate kinase
MVKDVTAPLQNTIRGSDRAMIVEIVGPAGAGKTTLFQALEKNDPRFQAEPLPPVWDFWYLSFFIKYILLLVPTLFRLRANEVKKLSRQELAWMAMLLGWPQLLRKKVESNHKVFLLDQGPIFLMAILSEFGPEGLRNPDINGYWEKVYERWTNTLDIVIWLDAADEILINRIRTRRADHIVKHKSDQEIKEFLAKYRVAYDRLLTLLMKNNHIQVIRLDTNKYSANDLVHYITELTYAHG